MKDLTGKKLLVLGNSYSTVNVVKHAKKLGLHVTVTGLIPNGQAEAFADEYYKVDTTDYPSLLQYIKEHAIDGVMTGSGEFNIINMINLCKLAGLPVYATKEQWDVCQDKRNFKDLCKKYGVPGVPEFDVDDVLGNEDFPVIVKPVDGCSSRGINVCHNTEELEVAKQKALEASPAKKILIERYINNGGLTHVVKYVVVDGKFYMEVMGDRYVLNNGLITAITFFPSKNTDLFMRTVDPFVQKMFKSIGYNNGVFFLQSLPEGEHIYTYEMGLRTGGGMTYKLTEATSGNNDLEMLIHYAITGQMCEESDLDCIDANLKGKKAASMAMPLRLGTISSVSGLDEIIKMDGVVNLTHFYEVGDTIVPKNINTLDQLFARVMVARDSQEELMETLNGIRNTVSVKDTEGNEMIIWDTFDRLYQEYHVSK